MPIIKSAIKRVRQQKRRKQRNDIVRNRFRSLMKEFDALIEGGKKAEAKKLFPQVQKSIDMAAKKNLLHGNTAGRKISVLAKKLA
jgi:small subunit ribosomal protein S20